MRTRCHVQPTALPGYPAARPACVPAAQGTFPDRMPLLRRMTALLVRRSASLCLLVVVTSPLTAQSPPGESSLGLRGIGALGLLAAYARLDRGVDAFEAIAELDLGHFASRRVRLGAEAAFLRSRSHSEFVVAEDTTYRDVFYDLSGHVTLGVLLRDPIRRVVPYVTGSVGVHVLTSSFGAIPIDLRYNTNVFGLRSGAGLRVRTGSQRAIVIEWNASIAREVSRRSIRVGASWLFGDLVRR